ncbi:outer membrane protein assembly factor [Hymenobacter tibetensis]|uniref:Outer membrane protein assembly factor n=1 Tax=Hymenobacter tibetensis TaxID=497967 RepID=A0ABY4CSY7_9BACT|nr:BamA/TamA family outer membrane protein [Hymenobacter tibetensis]UOG73371.1 outer membrane protein assembly factor [Hymenobacter tibetensis]
MLTLHWLPGALLTARAQTADPVPPFQVKDSIEVRASSQYQATTFKTWLLGANYRREWQQPVRVPLLNLSTAQGGLTPLRRGGGQQTKSLRLRAASGQEYVLRSVEKSTEQVLQQELRHTLAAKIVQDQISASHPYAALTVPLLAEAAGVGHTNPVLVYVPEDVRLGEFQAEFANTLALLEERDPVAPARFGNSSRVKGYSTEQVLGLLRKDARNRVDQRELLRARLLDMVLADWDRHDDQWRWLAYPQPQGGLLLRALPRDRDQVYFVNQGLLPNVASRDWAMPKVQGFDGTLRNVNTFMFNGRYFDRSFLNELPRAEWVALARELQTRLSDSVIDAALHRLPDSVYQWSGPRIARLLKAHRNALPTYAEQYYAFLAHEVDIIGSEQAERFEVERLDAARTRVRRHLLGTPAGAAPVYERVLLTAETREIRLYAGPGDDVVQVRGRASRGIRVRIIGGLGQDTIQDSSRVGGWARKTVVYDTRPDNALRLGTEARNRTATDSAVNQYNRRAYRYPYLGPLLPLGYNPDDGVFLGLGLEARRPGFRKEPWASVHRLQGNVALQTGAYSFAYQGDFSQLLGRQDLLLKAEVQAPNYVRNFFGLGNDTRRNNQQSIRYYRVRFRNIAFQALLRRHLGPRQQVYAGPMYQSVKVERTPGRYLDEHSPENPATSLYQAKHYAGARLGYIYDSRDITWQPTKGLYWRTEYTALGALNAAAMPVSQLTSEAAGFWTPWPRLTLGARVGGATHFRRYEFFQAATLGGLSNLRGYRRTRFAGESALYNNVEARARLGRFHSLLFSADYGLFGFHDVGRVWADGENSARWHRGYGGGLWLQPFPKVIVLGLYGISREDRLPLVRVGFFF